MKIWFCLLNFFVLVQTAFAQWSNDPSVNTRVTIGGLLPQIISDGNGGAYIVYQDSPALLRQLWVQRLDHHGYVRFSNNGVRISSENGNQTPYYFLVSDSAGGVIVVFEDFRVVGNQTSGAVYAQRIDSMGAKLWGEAGVEISPSAHGKAPVSACGDGASGVFVFWGVEKTDNNRAFQLWGQRVNARGELMWPKPGIQITNEFASFNVAIPNPAVSDGQAGAIILYSDSTGMKLQRINANGGFLWKNHGVEIFPVGRQMIDDGLGGVIIAGVRFVLDNNGYHFAVAAQRANTNGMILWGNNGITIEDTVTQDTRLSLAKDHLGGAVFGLSIFDRLSQSREWISKRISSKGNLLWIQNHIGGDVITDENSNTLFKTFVQISNSLFHFFVQRVDPNGQEVWAAPVLFSKTGGSIMVDDSQGGAIIVWSEIGANSRFGIFAQQVSRDGKLGEVLTTSVSERDNNPKFSEYILHPSYPNPFNSSMIIRYELYKSTFVRLSVLDLGGKEVINLVNVEQNPGMHKAVWTGQDQRGGDVVSGIYFYQLRAGNIVKIRKALLIK